MTPELLDGPAQAIAAAVASGQASAREVIETALARIAARNAALGAFTDITAARALARADAIDAARRRGERLGPLAGAPFAVKNLFDVEGLPTRAGSKINRDRAQAAKDATLVARLEAAGAILVGALNMDEYAYGFTGENAHDGPSRNPHDRARMTGGSSGGLGRRGRRRVGPARARLGHQRLDPRAELLLRRFRPEADLRTSVARGNFPLRREPRPSRPPCALGRRSRARL